MTNTVSTTTAPGAQASPAHAHDGSTMRAVVQDGYGSADVLRLDRIGRPEPAANEVLLRVHAAGLDRGAWHLMTGRPYLVRLATGLRKPRNPVRGREVAGTVMSVGASVTRFAVGDEVFGIGTGSFAEYAVARETKLAHKPAGTSFSEAAVVGISGLTALQALRDAGRVEAGQRVLILGASGGVGTFSVQLAKAFGAEVTGVCGTAKIGLISSLGADHVIDYTMEDFADGERQYDVILDIAGNPSLSRLRRALTPTGTAVIVGGEQGGNFSGGQNRPFRALALSIAVRQRFSMVLCRENSGDLERLAEMMAAGTVTPTVDRTYPLDQTPAAMRHLEAGEARGKVAITS